ncbi:MAG: site-specific integrase [Paraclostridium sordellii]
MQLKEIIEEFLLELDIRGASKETIRSYTNSLKVFSDYIGEIEVEKIKAVHIKGFAKFNKDRGLKQKTQSGYISAVRALYSYMIEEEIVTKNLGYSVKLVNATDKKEIDVFTSEEIKSTIDEYAENYIKPNIIEPLKEIGFKELLFKICVVGGGAKALERYLVKNPSIVILDECIFSNVLGAKIISTRRSK